MRQMTVGGSVVTRKVDLPSKADLDEQVTVLCIGKGGAGSDNADANTTGQVGNSCGQAGSKHGEPGKVVRHFDHAVILRAGVHLEKFKIV